MSVEIEKFKGRFGNKLFSYITARIFAEVNNLSFLVNFKCFIDIRPPIVYEIYENMDIKYITFKDIVNNEIKFVGTKRYIFKGYFQNSDYLNEHNRLIKSFFKLDNIALNYDDLAIHLRLSDFYRDDNFTEVITPDYYLNSINLFNFNKLYIVVDKIRNKWEEDYLEIFEKFNPIIINISDEYDFKFILSLNQIICSNSSFCYWAVALSNSKNIVTFKHHGYVSNRLIKHGDFITNLSNIRNISRPLEIHPPFLVKNSNKLNIISAKYGTLNKWLDITPNVQTMVNNNHNNLYISKNINVNLLFTDPYPGKGKKIIIKYNQHILEVAENKSKLVSSINICYLSESLEKIVSKYNVKNQYSYRFIVSKINSITNCNLLIFGINDDNKLWKSANNSGYTKIIKNHKDIEHEINLYDKSWDIIIIDLEDDVFKNICIKHASYITNAIIFVNGCDTSINMERYLTLKFMYKNYLHLDFIYFFNKNT